MFAFGKFRLQPRSTLGEGGGGRCQLGLAWPLAQSLGGAEIVESVLSCLIFARIQHIEQLTFDPPFDPLACGLCSLGFHHPNRVRHQIADHRIDVPANIADLGELGCFHFHERRPCNLGKPPRDLGLPDSRRSDHQNILRRDFVPFGLGQLLATEAVAQRHRYRPLRRCLANHVPIQFGDNLARRERFDREGHLPSSYLARAKRTSATISFRRPAAVTASATEVVIPERES